MDGSDEVRGDLAGQHHLDDLHRLLVGDPKALLELGLQAESLAHGGDLRTATVHEHRLHADVAEKDDVQQRLVAGLLDRVAPDLDDDDLAVEPLDVRQRFDQDFGAFGDRQCHVV